MRRSSRSSAGAALAGLAIAGTLGVGAKLPLRIGPASAASAPPVVKAVARFGAAFAPDSVIATDGRLVVGAAPSIVGCSLFVLDPMTEARSRIRLERCGLSLAADGDLVYLDTATARPATDSYVIRVEVVDLATGTVRLLPAVSARLALGSVIAHTGFAYAAGSLWFVADFGSSPEALQLSRSTGQVTSVSRDVPPIGLTPLIATTPGVLWIAGGAGTGLSLGRIVLATHRGALETPPGRYPSVYALTRAGHGLDFLSVAGTGPRDSRLGVLDAGGEPIAISSPEPLGSDLVMLGQNPYSVGPAGSCSAHALTIWRSDPSTLRTSALASVPAPGGACAALSGRFVAVLGGSLYVLSSSGSGSALYRITPPGS